MSVHVSVPLGADATAFPYQEESRASS